MNREEQIANRQKHKVYHNTLAVLRDAHKVIFRPSGKLLIQKSRIANATSDLVFVEASLRVLATNKRFKQLVINAFLELQHELGVDDVEFEVILFYPPLYIFNFLNNI